MIKRMLVVDDIEMNREILNNIFTKDWDVTEAHSGQEALTIIEEQKGDFDIVLLDLFMQDMTGFAILEKRKTMENFKSIPVVVITGSNHVDDQLRAFELGANEYITKPFNREVVSLRVNNVLVSAKERRNMLLKTELDEMTGLYQKTAAEQQMNHILQNSQGEENVLLVIDIDRFKMINDTFGHQTGDQIIKIVARHIAKLFRKSDIVGRIGGDEFAVLMVNVADLKFVRHKANELQRSLKENTNITIPEYVSLSIGIASNKGKNTSYEELFKKADAALYQAKEGGRAQYREYGVNLSAASAYKEHLTPEDRNMFVGKMVLIVEDQAVNRLLIKKILLKDYYVLEAENGMQALKILQERSDIDAILLDLRMPGMSGYEVLKKLPEIRRENIPVIVLTGENDAETEEKALNLGAIDFITKPIMPKILLSRVKNALIRNQAVMLERLRKKSELDDLTGLFNRNTFFANVRRMLDQHPTTKFAFVRFDIDKFRLYNSAMGEDEGNRLLRFIAGNLPRMAEDFAMCTFGRVDADIFCMCASYDRETLLRHAALAQREIGAYRQDYSVRISFGVYVIEDNSESIESIFTKATMGAEKCKDQYEETISFFESEMEAKAKEEIAISNRMNKALQERQFKVYLQAKYDLDTEKPCGAEALVRWLEPSEGIIAPVKFIQLFEKNGFITKLDYYMWEEVCKLLRRWKKQGMPMYPVSVNISRISMYNVNLPHILQELVQQYEVEPEYLQLEITESAYMSNPLLMKEIIENFHQMGFTVLMDDFGSGYSSLNTLKNIDVDILKVDMKFIPEKASDKKSAKILSSVVRMAGWLGMAVVAEGVETQAQRDYLRSIGCGFVQGYYYAKPVPVEEYENLIKTVGALPAHDYENKWEDVDVVWAINPEVEKFLQSMVLPVAIFESTENIPELIRANAAYIKVFNLWSREETLAALGTEALLAISKGIKEAAQSEEKVVCQFQYKKPDGEFRWYQLNLLKMGSIPKSSIICGIFCDITDEMFYKSQLSKIQKFMGKAVQKKIFTGDEDKEYKELFKSTRLHAFWRDEEVINED